LEINGDEMKKRVILRGPLLTRSGYGEHARFILRALRSQEEKYDIHALAVNWGKTGWIHEASEEREYIDSILNKTINYHQDSEKNNTPVEYDLSLQVTIPNEWEKMAKVNIGVTAGIETTKVAPLWIERANMMDRIIVVSNHSKDTYQNTSYSVTNKQTGEKIPNFKTSTPFDVIHYPVKDLETSKIDLDLKTSFNFLTVAQWGARKNLEATVLGFIKEFHDQEDVGLIVKSNVVKNNLLDRISLSGAIQDIVNRKAPDRKCKVYLLHGELSEEQMKSLYTNRKVKAYVTTTHGEGFGLPIFEAAYYGLPVIAPDWSGHVDFLYKPTKNKKGKVKNKAMFSRIDYTIRPVAREAVWEGVVVADSMWCYPEEKSYRNRMSDVYKDYGRFKKQATELKKWIVKSFTKEEMYQKVNDTISACYNEDVVVSNTPQINQENNTRFMMV